ncbi:MAG: aldose 1-epimerase [Lachnospiraceae bacterium]|nr:aldose 1-epimerase [Lachnospiraceae bacterium]
MSSIQAQTITYKGEPCIELRAGDYLAMIAPGIGSNVIRLRNEAHDIEFFRYHEETTIEEIKQSPEVYGLPTLYLPNRLDGGRLKTSDALYQLDVNEADLGNFIHGFLHKRQHTVVSLTTTDDTAVAVTEYVYDDKDDYFRYLPISFRAEFTFTLSQNGLSYAFTMTNLSNVQMPYGVCTHTTMMGPFTSDGKGEDMRLYVPIGEKWQLNNRCLPTGIFMPLDNHDRQYLTGSMVPVKQVINNDVYYAEMGDMDGKPFYGIVATDIASGKEIRYEVSRDYKFWVIWNDWGEKGYFCPEPMTWMIDAPNLPLAPEDTGYAELAPGESKTVTQHFYAVIPE